MCCVCAHLLVFWYCSFVGFFFFGKFEEFDLGFFFAIFADLLKWVFVFAFINCLVSEG